MLIALECTQAEGGCFKVPLSMLFYYSLSITLRHTHTHIHTPKSNSLISLHPAVWAATFFKAFSGENLSQIL